MRPADPKPPSPLAPAAQRPETLAGDAVDQGFRAFRKERYAEAIQAWSGIGRELPPRVRAALAEAHFRRALGQAEPLAAIRDLRDALKAVPDDGRFWYHLGLVHHRQSDWTGARVAYAQAERHGFPRRDPLAYVQGLVELEMDPSADPGRPLPGISLEADLIAPIRALLARDWTRLAAAGAVPAVAHAKGTPAAPGMAGLWRGIGQVGLGQWAQGIQTLGSLSQNLFPGPMEALRMVFLGRALDRAGRSGEARKLRAATLARTRNATLGAEVAEAAVAEMDAMLAGEQWSQAAAAARDLLKNVPCPRARAVAALALDRMGREAAGQGRWAEAAKHWREALELGGEVLPGAAACAHNLALALEAQEQWDPAASAWELALKALPRRITKAQVKAGTACMGLEPEALLRRREWIERRSLELRRRTGNADAVLRQRKALIKRHAGDIELRLDQAETLIAEGKNPAADREVAAVLRQAPEHPRAWEILGRIQLLEGIAEGAERSLRRALAADPGRVSARKALAQALATQSAHLPRKAHPDAVRMLEEAIGLAPKEGRYRLILADRLLEARAGEQARFQIGEALRLDPGCWREVLRFWVERGDLAQVQALVAEGEVQGDLLPDFYLEAGLNCMQQATELLEDPFLDLPRRSGGKGARGEAARAAKAQAWATYGRTLLERAVPSDASLDRLREVTHLLLGPHPDLALPYAERAVGLAPSDPMLLLDLAVAQSGAERIEAARKTLALAERAAKAGKGREAQGVQTVLGMVKSMGVEYLHAMYCKIMGHLDDLDDDDDPEFEEDLF
jgi:tetratricopeptide (TPR) repeat protein